MGLKAVKVGREGEWNCEKKKTFNCETTESGRNGKEIKQHYTATVRTVKSLDKLFEAQLDLILG